MEDRRLDEVISLPKILEEDHSQLGHCLGASLHLLATKHQSDCSQYGFCLNWQLAKHSFINGIYEQLLYCVLDIITVSTLKTHSSLIHQAFAASVSPTPLEVLWNGMGEPYDPLVNNECLTMLDGLVSRRLAAMLQSISSTETPMEQADKNSLVQKLVNLPDRCANRFQRDVPHSLQRHQYNHHLWAATNEALSSIRARLASGAASSVSFISALVGKLCLIGFAVDTWEALLPKIVMNQDFLLSRVFYTLVKGIPNWALEPAITALLLTVNNPDDVSALLGNMVLETKIGFIITDKILLQKCFTSDADKILYNVFGYLAASPTRIDLLNDTIQKLLSVWADPITIRHISATHHIYLCKAVVMSSRFLSTPSVLSAGLMSTLTNGLQNHLNSSDGPTRRAGMAVAEIFAAKISPAAEPLKFEYDIEVEKQIMALTLSYLPIQQNIGKISLADTAESMPEVKANLESTSPSAVDLDSDDDDLKPMGEYSDEVKVTGPAYLRDCMRGLMETQNRDLFERSLKSAPALIRANTHMLQEVAVEFCKIILHMGNEFALERFADLRHETLVSILVVCPHKVPEYLCSQFHHREYSVRQRLDMLEALSAAAIELSRPGGGDSISDIGQAESSFSTSSETPVWQQEVDRRIAAKTRRFARATKRPAIGTPNRFAPVAGSFFFPLLVGMNHDMQDYNPLMSEPLVLGQFLYSLGRIVAAAQNCPINTRMVAEVFPLHWFLRYHSEPAVRRALLFLVTMALFVLPPIELVTRFQSEATELKEWLASLLDTEDLGQLASQAMGLLQAHVKDGLLAQNCAD